MLVSGFWNISVRSGRLVCSCQRKLWLRLKHSTPLKLLNFQPGTGFIRNSSCLARQHMEGRLSSGPGSEHVLYTKYCNYQHNFNQHNHQYNSHQYFILESGALSALHLGKNRVPLIPLFDNFLLPSLYAEHKNSCLEFGFSWKGQCQQFKLGELIPCTDGWLS